MSKAHPPELKKFMDKKLDIKLNGGRSIQGILRGFDPFMNLVIDEGIGKRKDGTEESIGMVLALLINFEKLPKVDYAEYFGPRPVIVFVDKVYVPDPLDNHEHPMTVYDIDQHNLQSKFEMLPVNVVTPLRQNLLLLPPLSLQVLTLEGLVGAYLVPSSNDYHHHCNNDNDTNCSNHVYKIYDALTKSCK